MNILITGAGGFIGSHITRALTKDGHNITICLHNTETARQLWPDAKMIKTDFSRDHKVSDWLPRLAGVDIVVNAVGIIRESGTQTFDSLHTLAPIALFRASEMASVKKIIQISALATDESTLGQYHRSKFTADKFLMGLNTNWIILRPSIVYGPGAKSMSFFKAMASLPVIPLLNHGEQPVQPINIVDLLSVTRHLIRSENINQLVINLVGPTEISIREIYIKLRHWLGLGKCRFISIPSFLVLMAGWSGGFFGNTPVTKETIEMLRRGNTASVSPFVQQFGFVPTSFEQSLADLPAQQSDRWHAGLYFLRPLLRFSIALLWIFTGIISALVYPAELSYAMLAKAGISGSWAPVLLYSAASVDIILGLTILVSSRILLAGLIQIGLIILYSVIITFTQSELWFHPFGAVSKNIPLIIATLVMLVLERK